MTRTLLSTLLVVSLAAPLGADVTIVQTSTGKGMGMSADMSTKTYLKGLKMRTDTTNGDRVMSVIFDVGAQKMYSFDNRKKEADVWDMAAVAAEMSKSVAVDDIKASVTPNGQKKQIAGRSTDGYTIEVTVPATVGGAGGMAVTATLSGVVWIAKGAPGSADYAAFYRGAADKGFIFTDPRAAKGSPGQAKAMAEMYRKFAEIGGVPYETDMNIKMGGEGPMAGMLARLGNMTMTSTTQSVDPTALPDTLFAPPADYKLKPQK